MGGIRRSPERSISNLAHAAPIVTSFSIKSFEVRGRCLDAGEASKVAAMLRAGTVVELVLFSTAEARELLRELSEITASKVAPGVPSYCQLLAGSNACAMSWGYASEDCTTLLDIEPYPRLCRFLRIVQSVSDCLRSANEHLLLSVIPSLHKTYTYPRFYHRESLTSLTELQREGSVPSIYRMSWDLGLENCNEVLNVNIVPRSWLLDAQDYIKAEYAHLFQRQVFDIWKMSIEEMESVQAQMREEMLPFPETKHDLLPGRALVWLDSHHFHTVYLKKGRTLAELTARPRSVVIVNEFSDNSYRGIPWQKSLQPVLETIVGPSLMREEFT